jgi:hypothetical protein
VLLGTGRHGRQMLRFRRADVEKFMVICRIPQHCAGALEVCGDSIQNSEHDPWGVLDIRTVGLRNTATSSTVTILLIGPPGS